jgi:hypothetical protein
VSVGGAGRGGRIPIAVMLTGGDDLASLEDLMVVRPVLVANSASYWRWYGGFGLYASGRSDLRSHH